MERKIKALRLTHKGNWSCRRIWATYFWKLKKLLSFLAKKKIGGGVIGRCLHTSDEKNVLEKF